MKAVTAPGPVLRVAVDRRAGQSAFLLKVPEHVFKRCCSADAGEHIGDIELDPASPGALPVRLHLAAIETAEHSFPPTSCEIRKKADSAPVYAYTESNGAMAFTGKVVASGMVQIPLDNAARSIMQKRTHDAQAPKRPMQEFSGHCEPLLKRGQTSAKPRELRNKMDTDKLKTLVLKLFTTEREFWLQKELEAATQQPPDHLKAVLETMCIHGTGENRFKYQLKDAYRG